MHFTNNDTFCVRMPKIRRSTIVRQAALLAALAFASGSAMARTHHHHHRHHHSHHTRHFHVTASVVLPLVSPSPVSVAANYGHTAAIRLATAVNSARNAVEGRQLTTEDLRVAHEDEILAERDAARHERQVRVAAQVLALHSGDPVIAAYSMRGTRYVMGGTSRSGFDCSGFVRYILSCTDGVALPRTAAEQYYLGTPISRADLQPGDLVFFQNTYKRGISHVGIYAGNGMFVHACNPTKGVREDSLDSPYYAHHFAGGRRVKDSPESPRS